MIRIDQLKLALNQEEGDLLAAAAKALRLPPSAIREWHIYRKAVDARKKQDVHFVCSINAVVDCDEKKLLARNKNSHIRLAEDKPLQLPFYGEQALPPLVVGFGPAGMFAALTLARMGMKPIVIERGRPAAERMAAVERFWQKGQLQPENNVQFGEGGAGTFSDGKLTTGTKSPYIPYILRELAACGGGQDILYEAKPHIGTDRLVKVVSALRREICELGGQVLFSHKLRGLDIKDGSLRGVQVLTEQGAEDIPCSCCLLALGHSARDTFELLQKQGLALSPKAFAMGLRIEHSQGFIDTAQYGSFAGHPALPAADYKLAVHLPDGHTAYSFCMCPGGQVVAAASEPGGIVTNGMSLSARDGSNANSALLISLTPADFPSEGGPLAGMYWQRQIEQRCFAAGSGDYRAPAQLVGDFLAGRPSGRGGSIIPSYRPGVSWQSMEGLLPDLICTDLRQGLLAMDRQIPGFAQAEAVLTAPETRSSSPVRIERDGNCQTAVEGLFACGEGAGYAGGIMSSAADGMKCALAVGSFLAKK